MCGRRSHALLAAVLLVSGCSAGSFACEQDAECKHGDTLGVCQARGVCSFPDDVCASGQRFGEHSGELSKRCVPEASDTSTSSSSSSTESSAAETVAGTSDDTGPMRITQTGGPGEATSDGSTGEPVDPSLLLHFTFEDDLADGLDNAGALGGVASCTPGCPSTFAGPVGAAGLFDGTDDCGAVAHVAELVPEQFTVAIWVWREAPVPGFDVAFTKPVGDMPFNSWRLTVQGDEVQGELINAHVGLVDDQGVDSWASLPLGQWRHWAMVWTGEAMITYLDGALHEELPSTLIDWDEHPIYVGCDDDHGPEGITHYLHGALDDVRMYDRVLEASEIAELHALGVR